MDTLNHADYEDHNDQAPNTFTTPQDWEYPISEGRHPARIVDAEVMLHEKGYKLVSIRVEILDAPNPGHVESKWYHLNQRKVVQFFRREFKKIGFDVTKEEDAVAACKQLKNLFIEINVAYPSGSPVIYFLKRTGAPSPAINTAELWKD